MSFEQLFALYSRCLRLAHKHAFNPYASRDAEFWLSHAEKLDMRLNDMLTAAERL